MIRRFSLINSLLSKLRPSSDHFKSLQSQILNLTAENRDPSLISSLQVESSKFSGQAKLAEEIEAALSQLSEVEQLMEDPEMKAVALEEYSEVKNSLKTLEEEAIDMLMSRDPDDSSNIILEIRPGVGGTESALFSEDLLEMYMGYSALQRWSATVVSITKDIQLSKGCKEAILKIEGTDVYKSLKYEAGVHKVIRVPETEKSGRLHSSTAAVLVFPDKPPVDFQINEKDLKIETMRAKGAGGQHVNKTDSAVRITHIPTGINAQCQDSRSQHDNRASALEVIHARLYAQHKMQEEMKSIAARKSQMGTGDRSEKIRTYNFPQNRITDHRLGLHVTGIEEMLRGNLLQQFIDGAYKVKVKEFIDNLTN